MSSLMEMTRACYRVQQEQRLLAATSTLARWRVNISAKWQQVLHTALIVQIIIRSVMQAVGV